MNATLTTKCNEMFSVELGRICDPAEVCRLLAGKFGGFGSKLAHASRSQKELWHMRYGSDGRFGSLPIAAQEGVKAALAAVEKQCRELLDKVPDDWGVRLVPRRHCDSGSTAVYVADRFSPSGEQCLGEV